MCKMALGEKVPRNAVKSCLMSQKSIGSYVRWLRKPLYLPINACIIQTRNLTIPGPIKPHLFLLLPFIFGLNRQKTVDRPSQTGYFYSVLFWCYCVVRVFGKTTVYPGT